MSSTPNISMDYNSLRDMVMGRSYADKLALVRELEKDTFTVRFAELLERIRTRGGKGSITEDEITAEVEAVRSSRYNNR